MACVGFFCIYSHYRVTHGFEKHMDLKWRFLFENRLIKV